LYELSSGRRAVTAAKPILRGVAESVPKDSLCSAHDDAWSVDSAVLEEDVCSICGMDTKWGILDKSIILCDRCDGEFHVQCLTDVSPVRVSVKNWVCVLCKEELKELSWEDPRLHVNKVRLSHH
jgi:PHD-finger